MPTLRPRSARTLPALALLAALASLACGASDPPASIVLVSIDTLRADHTSLHGYPLATTPELQRLADEGAAFDVAYAATSTTAPTHATLFTSLHPISHGLVKNGLRLAPDFDTLAEILATRGWQTAGFVGSMVLTGIGLEQGFETYDAAFTAGTSKTFDHPGWKEAFGDRANEVNDRRGAATTDRAIEWLRSARNDQKPFLLFVHYFDPHAPYLPPEPFRERFSAPDETERSNTIQAYDGEIAYTDDQLGRLVRAVDAVDPKAIVVVTADHGEGLGSHGVQFHGARIYEPFVRVPLVIRWPGQIAPGQRFDAPVEVMDIAPTLLGLTNVTLEASAFQGRNLEPTLRAGVPLDPNHPVRLLRRHYRPGGVEGLPVKGLGHALRIGPLKYIEARFEGRSELYNLESDPDEAFNLAPFAGEVRDRMRAQLRGWLETNEREVLSDEIAEEDRRRLEALGYVQ